MKIAAVVVITVLGLVPGAGARAEERWNELLSDVLQYLDMDRAHLRELLDAGEILYAGMPEHEKLPEQLSVGGVLMLVDEVPAQQVVEAFIHSEALTRHADVRTVALFRGEQDADFEGVTLPEREVALLRSGDPTIHFNLSATEARRLGSARGDAMLATYREHLRQRFASYYQGGFAGMDPYQRSRQTDLPAIELQSAVDGMQFLQRHFRDFHHAITAPPRAGGGEREQLFMIVERRTDDRPLHILSRQLFEVSDRWGLGADIHFYPSHTYNAGLVLMGVTPYGERSLVFALIHLFTDEIRGFGSSVKKAIGRRQASEVLKDYFTTVREALGDPG